MKKNLFFIVLALCLSSFSSKKDNWQTVAYALLNSNSQTELAISSEETFSEIIIDFNAPDLSQATVTIFFEGEKKKTIPIFPNNESYAFQNTRNLKGDTMAQTFPDAEVTAWQKKFKPKGYENLKIERVVIAHSFRYNAYKVAPVREFRLMGKINQEK